MDWLEGSALAADGKGMYVYGFHGNKFVVWSRFSGKIAVSSQSMSSSVLSTLFFLKRV